MKMFQNTTQFFENDDFPEPNKTPPNTTLDKPYAIYRKNLPSGALHPPQTPKFSISQKKIDDWKDYSFLLKEQAYFQGQAVKFPGCISFRGFFGGSKKRDTFWAENNPRKIKAGSFFLKNVGYHWRLLGPLKIPMISNRFFTVEGDNKNLVPTGGR